MIRLLLLVLLFLFTSNLSFGQIANGDFESWTSGTPDGWTTIDGGITVVEETSTIHGGASSASIDVTTGDQASTDFRQTISVVVGVEYTFKVFIYHTEGNLQARLYVDTYRGYSDNNVTGNWQELSYVFTPSTTSIEIGLRFYDQTGFDGAEIVYVDDFTVSGGATNDPEPTNHVTSFSATANGHNQIDLSWTDAAGSQLPAGYLIKGSDVSFASISSPVDGTPEADAGFTLNVAQGIETASFVGLTETTQYFFKIFPYTNAGVNIDYKTDATVPQDDATTEAAPIVPNLVINEILADPDAALGDANGDGIVNTSADEFVEIVNLEGSSIDIGGYTIEDGVSVRHTFPASTVIPNAQSVVVFGGGTPSGIPGTVFIASSGLLGFNNSGDDVILRDDLGNIVANYTYGSEGGDNQSLAREPDYLGPFVKHSTIVTNPVLFSPGKENIGGTDLPVELTSFSASVSNKSIKLSWNTATELNNYGFEIQRSVEKEKWENVGFVNGNGTSNSPKDYSFVDNKLSNSSNYFYRLKQVDTDGSHEFSKTIEVVIGAPIDFKLDQNYPNPFNPATIISFTLPEDGFTRLTVFNSLGQEVKSLVNENLEAGYHQYNFNAVNLTSGVYYYKLEAGSFVQINKMMLLK